MIVPALSVCGALLAPRPRCAPPRLQLPIEPLNGIDLERQLGELTFSELTAAKLPDAETVMRGGAPGASLGPEQVKVGLFYGQLTRGEAAGTRVLVKVYSAEDNNALAAAASNSDIERVREQLEAAIGGGSSSGGSQMPSTSLAEALAFNEWAAHCRVQGSLAATGVLSDDAEKRGLSRLIGRLQSDGSRDEPARILHAFPWRGEQVRMALPTRLPPTLGGWAQLRRRGETSSSQLWDGSVPRRAAQARSRFVRGALRGALNGLASLHAAGLVHQSLSPSVILLSSDDDRKMEAGDSLKSWLTELAFCRDARSLALAYRTGPDGDELPSFDGVADPLEIGLLERAVRRTVRPGDPEERAAFARADEMREFGLLMLEAFVLFNAPSKGSAASGDDAATAGADTSAMTSLRLRTLCDATFVLADEDGYKSDGVDIPALRAYLEAEDSLRTGGVGGVEMLEKAGKPGTDPALAGAGTSGWDLLAWMMRPNWQDRPSAADALKHPFWSCPMFF